MKTKTIALIALLMLPAVPAFAAMKASVLPPWDGKTVPAGQQCKLNGGNGKTPPIKVTGMPDGTRWIVVEFNDRSYAPLANNGGHGKIGFPVSGSTATLPPVPGMTARLPGRAVVVAKARTSGRYASPGYLPPCSGGKGNRYTAVVKALDANSKLLEKVNINIGRY